jgi:hypothetical protein
VEAGGPASYLTLTEGTAVQSRDGAAVGEVRRILADAEEDIFDGLIVATPEGDRFVDAERVDSIAERLVVLSLSADEARALPEPSLNPATMDVSPEDVAESRAEYGVKGAFRRLRDWITGRY